MGLERYMERLRKFDYLVYHQMTGNPESFAKKLQMSRSSFYEFLEEVKLMGVPVQYNRDKKSYYYEKKGRICFHFHETLRPLNSNEVEESGAGYRTRQKYFCFVPDIADSFQITLCVPEQAIGVESSISSW